MDNLKQQIVQCAESRMLQVGIRSVTIDDICRELGISKKTFYVYFDGKDQMVEEMMMQHGTNWHLRLNNELSKMSILELATNFIKIQAKGHEQHKNVPAFVHDLKKYYPQQFDRYMQMNKANAGETFEYLIKKGIDEHIFRADIQVGRVRRIYESLHLLIIQHVLDDDLNPDSLCDSQYAMDIFLRGMVSEEGMQKIKSITNI